MGTQPGKESCENGADYQEGKPGKKSRRPGDGKCHQKLTGIVGNGSHNAGNPEVLFLEESAGKGHDSQTQQTACKAVGKGNGLTEEKAGKQNAAQEDRESLPGAIALQNHQSDDV